jgi:hypothetical protein
VLAVKTARIRGSDNALFKVGRITAFNALGLRSVVEA